MVAGRTLARRVRAARGSLTSGTPRPEHYEPGHRGRSGWRARWDRAAVEEADVLIIATERMREPLPSSATADCDPGEGCRSSRTATTRTGFDALCQAGRTIVWRQTFDILHSGADLPARAGTSPALLEGPWPTGRPTLPDGRLIRLRLLRGRPQERGPTRKPLDDRIAAAATSRGARAVLLPPCELQRGARRRCAALGRPPAACQGQALRLPDPGEGVRVRRHRSTDHHPRRAERSHGGADGADGEQCSR